MTDLLDLPFDQYQRYQLVTELLQSVRAEGECFRILDVGGRTALLRQFLPGDQVELVDVDPSDADGLVLGSGAQLPFQDGAFDAVCAFDTLEHVPPALRDAFVAECARVSRRYVILAGPYDAPRVAEAEQLLLDFLKARLDWEHRYLKEHRINGLPSADDTKRILGEAGAAVSTVGHGALDRWLLLMVLELYIEHEDLLRGVAEGIYRFYNEHLFRTDHGKEVYRHAVIATFGDAPVPNLDGVLEPAGSAPVEATQILLEAGQEILRYDALRDTYKPEMERLHAVVSGANKDLDEHKASLATVEADLEEHRNTVSELNASLERERGNAQAHAANLEERLGGVTADLAGHKRVLEELEACRANELRELEARGEALESANRALADQNAQLASLNEQLVQLNDEHKRTHDLLNAALHRAESKEEVEQNLRGEIARAVAAARGAEERDSALAGAELTLEEEVALMINARNRLLAERNEARQRAEVLAADANRLWNRLGRVVTRKKIDPAHLVMHEDKGEGQG